MGSYTVKVKYTPNQTPNLTCDMDPIEVSGGQATIVWQVDTTGTPFTFTGIDFKASKAGESSVTSQFPPDQVTIYDNGTALQVNDMDTVGSYPYTLHLEDANGNAIDFDPEIVNKG